MRPGDQYTSLSGKIATVTAIQISCAWTQGETVVSYIVNLSIDGLLVDGQPTIGKSKQIDLSGSLAPNRTDAQVVNAWQTAEASVVDRITQWMDTH